MITEVIADREYKRLDIFLAEKLDTTRSSVQKLITSRSVAREDGRPLKPSRPVMEGTRYTVDIPEPLNVTYLKADPVEFEVIYEDEYIFVINKPSGLVVHPAPGCWRNTLVNGLVYRYPEMRNLPNWLRPGIVHRLDGGTSGLMVVGRTQKAVLSMQRQFKARTVKKHYIALVHGVPERNAGILSGPIMRDPANPLHMIIAEGGKPSLTGYRVLWSNAGISLVTCELFTGRTHQIRVHMSSLGCPLVGDIFYGAKDAGLSRVYLHSWRLEFEHPATCERMSFRQPITPDFIERIRNVKAGRPVDYGESTSVRVTEEYDAENDAEYDG